MSTTIKTTVNLPHSSNITPSVPTNGPNVLEA